MGLRATHAGWAGGVWLRVDTADAGNAAWAWPPQVVVARCGGRTTDESRGGSRVGAVDNRSAPTNRYVGDGASPPSRRASASRHARSVRRPVSASKFQVVMLTETGIAELARCRPSVPSSASLGPPGAG